jgi:hypothetical protein
VVECQAEAVGFTIIRIDGTDRTQPAPIRSGSLAASKTPAAAHRPPVQLQERRLCPPNLSIVSLSSPSSIHLPVVHPGDQASAADELSQVRDGLGTPGDGDGAYRTHAAVPRRQCPRELKSVAVGGRH